MYLGNGIFPPPAFITSLLQKRLGVLRVHNLIDANAMLRETISLKPTIYFPKLDVKLSISLYNFSDASHTRCLNN